LGRRAVFDDASPIDDDDAVELARQPEIVRDTQQRGATPDAPAFLEQLRPLPEIEAAKRLVANHEPGITTEHRATQPHALTLAAGRRRAALAQRSLQALGQPFEYAVERRTMNRVPRADRGIRRRAVRDVLQQRTIPDVDLRIDPCRVAANLVEPTLDR